MVRGCRAPTAFTPDWTLSSEHRVGGLYRIGFVVMGLGGFGFIVAMARSILFGPAAAQATHSIGVWMLLAFLVALTLFALFVAVRSSSGHVELHQEGVVLTDLLGRLTSLPWSEVRKVTRLHSSAGPSAKRFTGWSLLRADGTRMVIPTMYSGVGPPLELLASQHNLSVEDEHL